MISRNALIVCLSLSAALAGGSAALGKDWKTVVVGTEGGYPPYNLTDSAGKIVGFEPDLLADLCARMKVECKTIAQDWDGMIPGLQAGKFDVIMDGMSITDDRKKVIDFSAPYASPPAIFLALKTSPLAKVPENGKIVSLDANSKDADQAIKDLQAAAKGLTIGVQVSTTHASFADKYLKGFATIKEYKTTDERDLDLKSGRIDFELDDQPTIAGVLDHPDTGDLAIVGPQFIGGVFGIGNGFGLRKSDADLTAMFDKALQGAIADGSVSKYSVKWFKIDVTPK
jgi:octopine/nopaline transport system substrate-binding protein